MTADECLAAIRVKVERAKKHIGDLQSAIKRFLASRPYVIRTKKDDQTRQRVYYVDSFAPISPEISAIAGDALQNLRSALDHLAYSLVVIGLGGPPPKPWLVAFPIADSAGEYPSVSQGKVEGMRQNAKDAIKATEPYQGGNGDILWRLHKLNNIDKHRLLLTIRSHPRSVDLGGYVFRRMQETFPTVAAAFPPDAMSAFFKVADRPPLTAGYEFFREPIEHKLDEHLKFIFDIAIGESGIIEGEPLLETLQHMADFVDSLILSFKPLLA